MPGSRTPAERGIRFEPDERPPRSLALGLGLQFALLNIGGIVPRLILFLAL